MIADCPKCGAECSVDYILARRDLCDCAECGTMFEVNGDADWAGDHWQDLSTPGKEVER
jgi:hypothetical protein